MRFMNGKELSASQKIAIINKLIKKKGKNGTLLNVDVKIACKAVAKRLQTVLPFIIHDNQCAYVKGRSIFDCTRIIDEYYTLY